jgi:membrane associated rhomboid family serine protease
MWARFLVYAFAASIPFVVWQRKQHVIYSFVIVVLVAVFEILCALAVGRDGHQVDVFAELFGVAAGILLGLNLRRMRASARRSAQISQKPGRSPIT